MSISVAIVGLGRVGRSILRTNFQHKENGRFKFKALCDVMPVSQVAYLIQHDSTYGIPPFSVECDSENLIIAGNKIRYVQVDRRKSQQQNNGLNELKELKIDVLVNATGTAQIKDLRNLIDKQITKKILCSWNISGGDKSLVYGVNEQQYDTNQHHVISASTCTGNAFAPLAYILDKHIGIDYARIITIHPALSDQHLLDGYHNKAHLGRTTAASIIPTKTNVADSTTLVLPKLAGKLDSLSYRVPTEIVSAMDVSATLSRETSLEEITGLLNQYASNKFSKILHCDYGKWGHEKVSIDFIDTQFSCIVLMNHLSLSNPCQLGISLMHDNERAYCCRALDILDVLSQGF